MFARQAALVFLPFFAGCSSDAHIKYTVFHDGDRLPPSALQFYLHESNITLTSARTLDELQKTSATDPKDNCAAGLDGAKYESWSKCFIGVNAIAAISAPGPTAELHVAIPNDDDSFGYITTSISGTEITSQYYTYSQITVQYKNNVPTAIQNSAGGAAGGFAIAGPGGAIVGAIFGFSTPIWDARQAKLMQAQVPVPAAPGGRPALTLKNFLCAPNDGVDTDDFKNLKNISLPLPIEIDASQIGLAPPDNLKTVSIPSGPGDIRGGCWSKLPNGSRPIAANLALLDEASEKGVSSRSAESGDGWLYRIVDETNRGDTLLGDEVEATKYFDQTTKNTFPYSSCRPVTVEILWWKELDTYISDYNVGKTTPSLPHIVKLHSISAYPKIVKLAQIGKGGVINFRPDCGATVSMTPDTSSSAIINATATAAQTISKAQSDWKSSK